MLAVFDLYLLFLTYACCFLLMFDVFYLYAHIEIEYR